ncbi:hypothetical protein ACF1BQ_026690 [Bradyrhizobium sp. RDT10]
MNDGHPDKRNDRIPAGIAGAIRRRIGAAEPGSGFRQISASVIYRNVACLDSFQYFPGISLELLENAAFPFASRRALKYR